MAKPTTEGQLSAKRGLGHGDHQPQTPPYVSFSALLAFLNKLNETAVPSRIDASLFGKASGAISYGVIAALKTFKLIDTNGAPNDEFRKLVAASEEARKPLFRDLLKRAYPTLFDGEIELATVSAGQFDEHIRTTYDAMGSTIDKIAAFFIAAAKYAGEPLSPHLLARKAIGSNGSAKQATQSDGHRESEQSDASAKQAPLHPAPIRLQTSR